MNEVVPEDRVPLQPEVDVEPISRGTSVLFAGFPHGINRLLVQQAVVAGPDPKGFYLDGSVNDGNSGGPIVDRQSGRAVGIVTQRRFPGANVLDETRAEAAQIVQQLAAVVAQQGQQQPGGSVQIMGVDFAELVRQINAYQLNSARASAVLAEILRINANTGLGVGFKMEYVLSECRRLGIA